MIPPILPPMWLFLVTLKLAADGVATYAGTLIEADRSAVADIQHYGGTVYKTPLRPEWLRKQIEQLWRSRLVKRRQDLGIWNFDPIDGARFHPNLVTYLRRSGRDYSPSAIERYEAVGYGPFGMRIDNGPKIDDDSISCICKISASVSSSLIMQISAMPESNLFVGCGTSKYFP